RGAVPIATVLPLLTRFALPGALSSLTTVPVLWLVQALLSRSTSGFSQLALYAASLNLLSAVLFVPSILNNVAMPWINRERAQGGEAAYRGAFRAAVRASALTMGVALAAVAVAGPWLLGLYGGAFRDGYPALLVLLAAAIPETLTVALNQGVQVRERMWQALVAVNLPRDAVILGGALLLIPTHGALGAAAAYLAGRLVAFVGVVWLVRHDLAAAQARLVESST
ncbi:MAG: hypothetical protein ACOY71_07470, partial [Gemmatimonadota bacterium]